MDRYDYKEWLPGVFIIQGSFLDADALAEKCRPDFGEALRQNYGHKLKSGTNLHSFFSLMLSALEAMS
jgi:hypothetical protein